MRGGKWRVVSLLRVVAHAFQVAGSLPAPFRRVWNYGGECGIK